MQEFDNEILIYDLLNDKAHCLNETSAIIYRACNQETPFDELKEKYEFTDDLIFLALDQLQKNDLIKGESIKYFDGLSRRDVIRKIGLSSMVALPLISSLIAPIGINAQSVCVNPGGLAPNSPVGPNAFTVRGMTCLFPDPVIDMNCNTSFGSQCLSCMANQRSCTINAQGNALYNCKCA